MLWCGNSVAWQGENYTRPPIFVSPRGELLSQRPRIVTIPKFIPRLAQIEPVNPGARETVSFQIQPSFILKERAKVTFANAGWSAKNKWDGSHTLVERQPWLAVRSNAWFGVLISS